MFVVFLSPLFVAELLIGISSLAFNARVLGLPGNILSAIAANVVEGIAFAFLIILSQLVRYDWQMDEAAMVFGANPLRCFWEITLPTIWPSLLGAFLISFILAFNNLEISFYNLGAIPTLPSVAWGSLRFGLGPEFFALAALTNALCIRHLRGDVFADENRARKIRLSRKLIKERNLGGYDSVRSRPIGPATTISRRMCLQSRQLAGSQFHTRQIH